MALISKASLLMVPSTYEPGTLYNVLPSGNRAPDSTDQNSGYDQTRADFTFDRGSNAAATRIGSDGLIKKYRENLYTESNNFSDSDWSPKAGVFTKGVSDPNGGNEAWSWKAQNTDPFLYQAKNFTGVHCLSIYVKGVGSTIGEDFQIRVGTNIKDITLTGDWQRVQHFGVLSSSVNIGFEYGNPATPNDVVHIYAAQLETGLVATDYLDSGATTAKAGVLVDLPRINYDANGENGSLLLEPSRVNLVTQSEYFGAGWSLLSGGSFAFNQTTSPEGVQNASTLSGDGVNANAAYFSASVTSGTAYAFSIYAKQNGQSLLRMRGFSPAAGGNVIFDLSDGTINTQPSDDFSNAKIEAVGTDGWYRCSVIATADATNSGALFGFDYSDSSASGGLFYVWGAQFESSASYPSSYIPNHGTTGGVTRAADSCSVTGASDVIGQSEGTIFAEFTPSSDVNTEVFQLLATNSIQNVVTIACGAGKIYGVVYTNSSYVANFSISQTIPNNTFKVALCYKNNDITFFINGQKVASNTNAYSGQADLTKILFNDQFLFGKQIVSYKKTLIFKSKLSDAECISLTS